MSMPRARTIPSVVTLPRFPAVPVSALPAQYCTLRSDELLPGRSRGHLVWLDRLRCLHWRSGKDQLALVPRGGAPTSATGLGLTYINGPWVAGFATGIIDTQGSANLTGISQRHQFETSAGGNYKLAPGVQLVLDTLTIRHIRVVSISHSTLPPLHRAGPTTT